jgi:hypothetical protein
MLTIVGKVKVPCSNPQVACGHNLGNLAIAQITSPSIDGNVQGLSFREALKMEIELPHKLLDNGTLGSGVAKAAY